MKYVRKAAAKLVLAALLCVVLATVAFAAGTGSVWVNVVESEGTSALIVTDTTVTDGVVKLTYDSAALTYQDVAVAEEYVAMYAVNAEEVGTVLISWVAPEAYELDGEAVSLMQVNFSGTSENAGITLTGAAHDAQGNTLALADAPDTAALEKVIAEAEALDGKEYSEESFADVEEALAAARKVLDDTTATQAEVNAAAAALRSAIDGLKKAEAPTQSETTESEGTSDSTATKATESTGDSASTGDNSNVVLFIILGIVSIVGIAVLVVLMVLSNKKDKKGRKAPAKKKGRYAK